MYPIASLALNAGDPRSVASEERVRELERLGLVDQGRSYVRGSPFERVLAAAHRHLTSVAREMNGLMWDPYMATEKGDARYYLRTHPQAVAS